MSFTINASTQAAYDSGRFEEQPELRKEGNPDPRATVTLGGWTSDNVMQFKVEQNSLSVASVHVNTNAEESLKVDVATSERRGDSAAYYQVTTGTDSRNSSWEIDFDVFNTDADKEAEYTGKWKFTKGRLIDTLKPSYGL